MLNWDKSLEWATDSKYSAIKIIGEWDMWRIYTQDIYRADIIEILNNHFDGYTLIEAKGCSLESQEVVALFKDLVKGYSITTANPDVAQDFLKDIQKLYPFVTLSLVEENQTIPAENPECSS